jgi:hypothetical protein
MPLTNLNDLLDSIPMFEKRFVKRAMGRDVTAYSEAAAEAKRQRTLPVRLVDTPQAWSELFDRVSWGHFMLLSHHNLINTPAMFRRVVQ